MNDGRKTGLNKLSAVGVAQTKKVGMYGDGGGLWLQVSKFGTKSWIFRFTLNGRTRDMGLGPLHTISLARAREKARNAREQLLDGIDPIEKKKQEKEVARLESAGATTFEQAAKAYIEVHEPSWKNAKHISQWKNTLATYVYPVFGKTPVGRVDTNLVMKAIQPIWNDKRETASRVRSRIENVLDWAKSSGMMEGENPARWRGHLQNLLPKRSSLKEVKHLPALPYKEISNFMEQLSNVKGVGARALEFTILTCLRSSEVRTATWDEVIWDECILQVPGERMKGGKDHKVPLSSKTIGILKELNKVSQSEYIFPGLKEGKPISDGTMLKTLKSMEYAKCTVHGFRSTFKDWAADCTSYQNEVSEMALAHTIDSKVEAAYRRGELLEKRTNLMNDWALYCERAKTSTNVLSINGSNNV